MTKYLLENFLSLSCSLVIPLLRGLDILFTVRSQVLQAAVLRGQPLCPGIYKPRDSQICFIGQDLALSCSPNQSDFSWPIVKQRGEVFLPWGAAVWVIIIYKVIHIFLRDKQITLSLNPRQPVNSIHSEWLRPTLWKLWWRHRNLSSPPTHELSNILHSEGNSLQWKFLCAVHTASSYQQHLLLSYCGVCNGAIESWDPRLFLTESFDLCCQDLERGCVRFLTEFGKCRYFSNMARDFWRGRVLNFLAGVKEAGLSHRWCSRASIFSFVRAVLFSSSHTYAAVCMVFYTVSGSRCAKEDDLLWLHSMPGVEPTFWEHTCLRLAAWVFRYA